VTRGWRKQNNEGLLNLYASTDIIGMIKSRMMRWAGHVVRTGEIRNVYIMLIGKTEGSKPLEDGIGGWVVWIGVIWLSIGKGSALL
jgi:hypothetical protein